MTANVLKRMLLVCASCRFPYPLSALAQSATSIGAITDSIGAVLPGVTITAVNDASGNTLSALTDERGQFRLPVRVGNQPRMLQLGFRLAF